MTKRVKSYNDGTSEPMGIRSSQAYRGYLITFNPLYDATAYVITNADDFISYAPTLDVAKAIINELTKE